jgi:uncharacterized protein YbcI
LSRGVSDRLAALHAYWYGKGPSAARTYIAGDDVVVIVLEESFTPVEQALVDRGEADGMREIRRRFRRVMADEVEAIVEQATGRRVRSYVSDAGLDERVSIEVFLLGVPLEDMSGFETAGETEGRIRRILKAQSAMAAVAPSVDERSLSARRNGATVKSSSWGPVRSAPASDARSAF